MRILLSLLTMKGIKFTFFVLVFFGFKTTLNAQNITVDQNLTANQLVQNILINNPCANISNVSVTTWDFGNGKSFGRFTSGGSAFPFAEGVLLTTGRATSAIGPNNAITSEGPTNWQGDGDLEDALNIGQSSVNATVLEFDFLPLSNKISFDYIFSSEQYLLNGTQNQCNFTDGFVFLLKKANTSETYINLAVVPGTTTPVRVNTVRGPGSICPPSNPQFFDAFNGVNHPTNYNGQTKILSAKATVVPGTLYHIKLVVADQGNNLYDSAIFLGAGSFKVEKDLGPNRLVSLSNPLCNGRTLDLFAIEPGINTYQWSRNGTAIAGATNGIYTVTQGGIYAVSITLGSSGCVSTGQITIEYAPALTPSPAVLVQCDPDNDGFTLFNLKNAETKIKSTDATIQTIKYYTDAAADDLISNPTSFISAETIVYAKVFNSYNCFAIVPITLSISNDMPIPPAPLVFCDEDGTKDGIRQFNFSADVSPEVLNGLPQGLEVAYFLNVDDALTTANILPNLYIITTVGQQIVWARITNGPDCYGIIPVTLIVNFLEVPNFDDEEKIICQGLTAATLSVPNGFQSYLWSDANTSTSNAINVSTGGDYTVKVTDAGGCSDTKTFSVVASTTATITEVVISDFKGGNNTVTIQYDGFGIYEFSLDGSFYQATPTFYNVPPGAYTVFVQNFCGRVTKDIFVLDYPKYFTPNGDGYNDVWKIDYLQKQNRMAHVHIFDRYGKLLFSGLGDNDGWDGTFNSGVLPASDYWFTIILEDKRVVKGHFSLKR
jgi:gliding motility-associated-like protein